MLIAGNWKMHTTSAEAFTLASRICESVHSDGASEVVVCPPFVSMRAAADAVAGSRIMLGAQTMFWETQGAFTGEVSADMLLEFGCRFCIVGHSERRGRFGKSDLPANLLAYFSETDAVVARKFSAALGAGLIPILCVGETEKERAEHRTEQVIQTQLNAALCAGTDARFVIAYEPVWAIGTGDVCEPDEADRVCAFIRTAAKKAGTSEQFQVVYGGSVNAENARALLERESVEGVLVGGASLKPDEFSKIIAIGDEIAK